MKAFDVNAPVQTPTQRQNRTKETNFRLENSCPISLSGFLASSPLVNGIWKTYNLK